MTLSNAEQTQYDNYGSTNEYVHRLTISPLDSIWIAELEGIMIGADIIAVGDVDLHWYDEDDLSYQHRNYRGYRICTEYQLFVDRIKLGREKDLVEMRLLNKHYSELPEYLKDRYNQLINHK